MKHPPPKSEPERDPSAIEGGHRARDEQEPESGMPPSPAVRSTPLERWAEVWETLRQSVDDADEYNLDRKRTVLSILMALARATRM